MQHTVTRSEIFRPLSRVLCASLPIARSLARRLLLFLVLVLINDLLCQPLRCIANRSCNLRWSILRAFLDALFFQGSTTTGSPRCRIVCILHESPPWGQTQPTTTTSTRQRLYQLYSTHHNRQLPPFWHRLLPSSTPSSISPRARSSMAAQHIALFPSH